MGAKKSLGNCFPRNFWSRHLFQLMLHCRPLKVIDKIDQVEDAADEGEMPPLEGAEEDASRMEEVRHGLCGSDCCIEVEATNCIRLSAYGMSTTLLTGVYPSGGLIVLLASSPHFCHQFCYICHPRSIYLMAINI